VVSSLNWSSFRDIDVLEICLLLCKKNIAIHNIVVGSGRLSDAGVTAVAKVLSMHGRTGIIKLATSSCVRVCNGCQILTVREEWPL